MGLNADITVHGWRKPTLTVSLVAGGTIETAQIQNFRLCGEQAIQVNEITGENTFPL